MGDSQNKLHSWTSCVCEHRTDDDPKECRRLKKDSFYWYQKVLKSNGEDLE